MAWDPQWLGQGKPRQRDLWRGVEAQHRVATLRLVDDHEEQALLEQLLEASKPPAPPSAQGRSFLLFTPFRYASPCPSRFRLASHPGAWYGADEPVTVAAEIAHWRRRFFSDSNGLREQQVLVEFTFFQARFRGIELDITQPPWSAQRDAWRHPGDYATCHELATQARAAQPPIEAIRYESARREGGLCQVVFALEALSIANPGMQQTWTCKMTRQRILMSHDQERLQFDMA
jgi:hypothetical protein